MQTNAARRLNPAGRSFACLTKSACQAQTQGVGRRIVPFSPIFAVPALPSIV